MSNELPFKLPVRIESTGEADWVIDAGNHQIAQCYDYTDAEGIMAALNGYAAMREACQYVINVRDAHTDRYARDVLRVSAEKCAAALNPPAATAAAKVTP